MIKRGEKKAQDLSITTLVLIVLGVVVLVVIAIGVTQGFDAVFGIFKQGPGDLELRVQACNIAAQRNLRATYCDDFKEIKLPSGDKLYANCEFTQIQNNLNAENRAKFVCGESVQSFCNSLVTTKKLSEVNDRKRINDQYCTRVTDTTGELTIQ